MLIQRRRMAEPGNQVDENQKEKPGRLDQNGEKGEGEKDQVVNQDASAVKQGIDDVPSIQLTHGQEVESSDEQSSPSGRGKGMKLEAAAWSEWSVNPFNQK